MTPPTVLPINPYLLTYSRVIRVSIEPSGHVIWDEKEGSSIANKEVLIKRGIIAGSVVLLLGAWALERRRVHGKIYPGRIIRRGYP